MDNINLLYVAFTRAEEQLYIFSTAEKEGKEEALPQNVCRLLTSIIRKIELNDFTFLGNEFVYGSISTKPVEDAQCLSTKNITSRSFNNYKEKIKLVTKDEYNDAQIKGNKLHSVLSKIYNPDHVPKAIKSLIADQNVIGVYEETIAKILDEFINRNWLDNKWKQINERAIWYEKQELRPDKVLLSEDECIILDYKSGAKKSEHLKKMKDYIRAYSSFYPQKMSAYLIYVENMDVIPIT